MTGFESQTSCIGSDRSTNWATTTAQLYEVLLLPFCTYPLCAHNNNVLTHVQEVVGSNPGVEYWMDMTFFHIDLL